MPSKSEADVFEPYGVLLIDELNRAKSEVLQGLFELLGEGTISQSDYEVPDGWNIICAANFEDDSYDITPLDPALKDRMLHVVVSWNHDSWTKWAEGVGLESDVIDFVSSNQEIVYDGKLAPAHIFSHPTPRSLEYFATLYKPDMDPELLKICAIGLLGEEAGNKFLASKKGGKIRPLTGEQVLKGAWKRYLDRWQTPSGAAAAETTAANLLQFLVSNQPGWEETGALLEFSLAIPASLRARLLSGVKTHAPEWNEMLWQQDKRYGGKLTQAIRAQAIDLMSGN